MGIFNFIFSKAEFDEYDWNSVKPAYNKAREKGDSLYAAFIVKLLIIKNELDDASPEGEIKLAYQLKKQAEENMDFKMFDSIVDWLVGACILFSHSKEELTRELKQRLTEEFYEKAFSKFSNNELNTLLPISISNYEPKHNILLSLGGWLPEIPDIRNNNELNFPTIRHYYYECMCDCGRRISLELGEPLSESHRVPLCKCGERYACSLIPPPPNKRYK